MLSAILKIKVIGPVFLSQNCLTFSVYFFAEHTVFRKLTFFTKIQSSLFCITKNSNEHHFSIFSNLHFRHPIFNKKNPRTPTISLIPFYGSFLYAMLFLRQINLKSQKEIKNTFAPELVHITALDEMCSGNIYPFSVKKSNSCLIQVQRFSR